MCMSVGTEKLSYTNSGLKHYLQYLSMPASQKTSWLLDLAREDAYCSKIIAEMISYGYGIEHKLFGHSGSYIPINIEMAGDCKIEDEVRLMHDRGEMQARFSFSSRYGGAQIAHYFLHELIHFWQDLHGLYLTPLIQKDATPVMLDASSYIAVICFCEAMAETDAIRASWRLKEAGYPIAWQGALASIDWRKHARYYEKDLHVLSEIEAARRSFDRWYESSQRSYYEKRALSSYKKTLNKLSANSSDEVKEKLRHVDLEELIKILPKSERPDYLDLAEYKSLNDELYTKISHNNTLKASSNSGRALWSLY